MAHLTNFSFEFFYDIFTEDASLLFLYHDAKKSKMTKNSNQGGPVLISSRTRNKSNLPSMVYILGTGLLPFYFSNSLLLSIFKYPPKVQFVIPVLNPPISIGRFLVINTVSHRFPVH